MIIATAIAAVSLAACGKTEDKAPAPATTSQNGFTVTTREGDTVTSLVAVPAPPPAAPGAPAAPPAPALRVTTPDYAPLYPGATLKASSTTTAHDHQVGSVTYVTSALPRTVVDFYKPRATAAGFTTSADANIGVGLMYAATDTMNERTLQVIATAEKSGTAVVLSWTSPKS